MGRTGRDQPKVVQEVLADLKIKVAVGAVGTEGRCILSQVMITIMITIMRAMGKMIVLKAMLF